MSPHTGGFWIFPAAVTVNGSKKMRNSQNNMDSAELEGVGRVVEKLMHYAPTVLQGAPAAFAFRLKTPSRFLIQGVSVERSVVMGWVRNAESTAYIPTI